MVAKR